MSLYHTRLAEFGTRTSDYNQYKDGNNERSIYRIPLELMYDIFNRVFYDPPSTGTLNANDEGKSPVLVPAKDVPQDVKSHFNKFTTPSQQFDHPSYLRSISHKFSQSLAAYRFYSSISGTQYGQCTPHPDLIQTWMDIALTSDTYPLQLHLSPPLIKCEHHNGFDSEEDDYTDDILDIFLEAKVMRKWEGVSFVFDEKMATKFLEIFPEDPTPQLKIAEFDAFDCNMDTARTLFLSITNQNIEAFSWHGPVGFTPANESVKLPCLKRLHIKGPTFEDVEKVLERIDGAVLLEEVHVEFTKQESNNLITAQKVQKIKSLFKVLASMEELQSGRKPTRIEVVHNARMESEGWEGWVKECSDFGVTCLQVEHGPGSPSKDFGISTTTVWEDQYKCRGITTILL